MPPAPPPLPAGAELPPPLVEPLPPLPDVPLVACEAPLLPEEPPLEPAGLEPPPRLPPFGAPAQWAQARERARSPQTRRYGCMDCPRRPRPRCQLVKRGPLIPGSAVAPAH